MEMTTVISLQGVSKKYQLRDAVRNMTLDVPIGKVVGLIGENGSGKTTTLKLMTGLLRPSKGRVLLQNQPVSRRLAAEQVAYLSDSTAVYPFYTIREMVNYYQGIFADFDIDKAMDMLKFMNLDPTQHIRTLSKGNIGRLKIALTASRNVPLMVMDEPLSGLDPLVRQSIMKSLISFIDLERQTVILSTHEVDEVEPLLDIAILIDKGRVLAMEYTDQIREERGQNIVEWMKTTLSKANDSE